MAGTPRTLLIACGALAWEIMAMKRAAGLDALEVQCLPADWHNRPERIPEGVRAKIRENRELFDRILVAYGDCGTGGLLDRVLEEEGVSRIPGAHCYQFYMGHAEFDALMADEPGTLFLTDYLAKHFDLLLWQGLGLDRHPELIGMYFGNYRRLVYMAQVEDPAVEAMARAAAARLGLEYEYRFTGYGELGDFIARAVATSDPRGEADGHADRRLLA